MTASKEDIEDWKERGKKMGATHIISVCDTFDWNDYPIFVSSENELEERLSHYRTASMQKINEVIEL